MASGPKWRSSRTVKPSRRDGPEYSARTKPENCIVSRATAAAGLSTHAVILRPFTEFLANNPVQGRRLRIHLFDTSASPPRLIAHTCGAAPCIANARSFEAQTRPPPMPVATQPVTSTPMYTQQPTAYAVLPPSPYYHSPSPAMPSQPPLQSTSAYSMQALQTSMGGMRMDPADPAAVAATRARMAQAYAQQVAAQQSITQSRLQSQVQGPVYVSSPIGTHVNVGQGVIKTEVRGVFVSNIDYKAGTRDLQRFFSRAGKIVHCQLQKDPATGKSKGNATVQYAAANDAKNAVRLFHNEKYMGMLLKVRLDREPVAVGVPAASSSRSTGTASTTRPAQQSRNSTEPIIVNGSIC
jgi:hypothetical protein